MAVSPGLRAAHAQGVLDQQADGLGMGEVRFHDVTMSVSAGEAPVLPDDVRARFARTDFILDMYESGVYDRGGRGEAARPSLRQGSYGNGFRGLKTGSVISVFRIYRFRYRGIQSVEGIASRFDRGCLTCLSVAAVLVATLRRVRLFRLMPVFTGFGFSVKRCPGPSVFRYPVPAGSS